ncbi:glycosyltransferase, group 1 family protein [SAR86 cluster bacterium SAR86E]|uniref:Glycosyltransferase, group 1 family protein n=1 Tax=SAR86 cluster bacterium SAR86E TaxID=1208365 RepID=K6G4P6_9GAMM|nr:glycosyltransferase, group 1 family protein [SAR86 cluster bacterium SAR86E]
MKVAILYSHFPHYREAVFKSLLSHKEIEFQIFTGSISDLNGIKCISDHQISVLKTKKFGNFYIQSGFLRILCNEKYDAIILLGDWKILSYWFYAIAAKIFSVKVLFWTHGWLRRRSFIHRFITNSFYSLADVLLVYGSRARNIGMSQGFDGNRIAVIYNSLDTEKQIAQIPYLKKTTSSEKFFLSLGRLTPELDLMLMLQAMKNLKDNYNQIITLKVVGDGPCRDELEAYAKKNSLKVNFLGAIYDESKLAMLIYSAKAVIAPGKAGLIVMHSLIYGTPVITHNNFDQQMPEAEALVDEFSNGFFRQGNISSLVETLKFWWVKDYEPLIRLKGFDIIMNKYTPTSQVRYISRVISEVCKK